MEYPVTLFGWAAFALAAFITSITAIAGREVISYARARIHNQAFDRLTNWAGTYVRALSQDPSLEGLANEEKKQRAMVWVVGKAADLGIEVSPSEASRLVEEAVWIVKNSALPALADALDQ